MGHLDPYIDFGREYLKEHVKHVLNVSLLLRRERH